MRSKKLSLGSTVILAMFVIATLMTAPIPLAVSMVQRVAAAFSESAWCSSCSTL